MKRILSAVVLFVLLTLTIVALNKIDAPKANAGTTTDLGHVTLDARRPQ